MASNDRTRKNGLWRTLYVLAALQSTFALARDAAPETGDCSLQNTAPATIVGIGEDLSLTLDDGRRVALSGLEFPAPERAEARAAARQRVTNWLLGRTVFVGGFSTAVSRWSRLPARLFADEGTSKDAPLVSVGAALLEEGFARFLPDPVAAPCAKAYLAAEAAARETERGVWGQVGLRPIAAENRAALPERKGLTVVEGQIRSTGASDRAIFLNFDNKIMEGFAVVISRRNLAMFAAAGIDPTTLVGRRARVRGLIETGLGPRIEISSPAEIELIDVPAR